MGDSGGQLGHAARTGVPLEQRFTDAEAGIGAGCINEYRGFNFILVNSGKTPE
jgi:hypothetical protein